MKKDPVVKIDADLLEEVEEFLDKGKNRLKYSSKKQFVCIAVSELLNKEQKNINSKK